MDYNEEQAQSHMRRLERLPDQDDWHRCIQCDKWNHTNNLVLDNIGRVYYCRCCLAKYDVLFSPNGREVLIIEKNDMAAQTEIYRELKAAGKTAQEIREIMGISIPIYLDIVEAAILQQPYSCPAYIKKNSLELAEIWDRLETIIQELAVEKDSEVRDRLNNEFDILKYIYAHSSAYDGIIDKKKIEEKIKP